MPVRLRSVLFARFNASPTASCHPFGEDPMIVVTRATAITHLLSRSWGFWRSEGGPRVAVGARMVKVVPSGRLTPESTNSRDWCEPCNAPVLGRLIGRAYRDDLPRQQAGVRVLQARARLGIAVGAIFPQSPQAVGSVQYNRTSDRASSAAFFK